MIPLHFTPEFTQGLIELCNLGWLDPEQLRDRRAAADAVIELTNAALSNSCERVQARR